MFHSMRAFIVMFSLSHDMKPRSPQDRLILAVRY